MDQYDVDRLKEKLNNVLKEFNIANDVVVSLGSFRYNSDAMWTKIEIREMGSGANPHLDAEANEFLRVGPSCGFKPEDLNREFYVNGNYFTISGMKSRNYKLPIIVKNSRGKRFKMSMETVLKGLGRSSNKSSV